MNKKKKTAERSISCNDDHLFKTTHYRAPQGGALAQPGRQDGIRKDP